MADSPGILARVAGFSANLAINGRTLRRDNGETIQSLIADADMVELQGAMGGDSREKLSVDILKPIPNFARDEVVLLVDEQVKIQLLTRKDSPVDPIARFGARKMTADDL